MEVPIVLSFDYTDFEDYWSKLLDRSDTDCPTSDRPCPPDLRSEIEDHVRAGYLAGLPDGSRSFAVVLRAVRGTVPRR